MDDDQKSEKVPHPLSIEVPICRISEVNLMGALEFVVKHFQQDGMPSGHVPDETPVSVRRAVDWLYAKYGSNKAI